MKAIYCALAIIILCLACNSGEGGNHPVNPPESDTVKVDSVEKDSVRYKPIP